MLAKLLGRVPLRRQPERNAHDASGLPPNEFFPSRRPPVNLFVPILRGDLCNEFFQGWTLLGMAQFDTTDQGSDLNAFSFSQMRLFSHGLRNPHRQTASPFF